MEKQKGFQMGALQPLQQQNHQWVYADGEQAVTDSLIVAEVFKKDHDKVMRDIKNQISKLKEAGEEDWGSANFGVTQYQHPQNKQWYPKINMTEDAFTLVAMAYVTPEAMKFKVRFIQEFKRIKEELIKQQETSQMSTEQLTSMLTIRLGEDVGALKEKIETVETTFAQRMDDFELNAPILPQQAESLTVYVKQKVYSIINANYGGNDSISSKLFARVGRDIKKAFGVNKRSMIAKKDFDRAVDFVRAWEPDSVTRYQLQLDLTDQAIANQDLH